MTALRPARLAASGLAAAALMGAFAASAQEPSAPPAAPKAYVDGFCLPLAGGYVADADTSRFLREWDARPLPAAEASSAQPVDVTVTGQLIRFADAEAPTAFLENRRGVCTLVWTGAAVPKAALQELFTDQPPVGENGAKVKWAKITPAYGGAPPPPKYLLRIGGREDRGVCAERLEDLRRRDGAPVSLLRLAPCRLAPGEKLDD